ncbi:hypothetical protein D3C81_1618410 [compost metagenome]
MLRGLDPALGQVVGGALVRYAQWSALAMGFASETLVVLAALEVGQHLLVRPTWAAHGFPVVVVLGAAAHIDHGVDRAAATEYAPLDHFRRDAVLFALRFEFVAGQQVALGRLEVGHGHVDVGVPVT